jgi:multidrug efflux pump subunit AcrA (membrane-fusion protein)
MSDSLSLNGVSSFLKKNSLKSSAIGYVRQVNVKIGDYVEQGQVLFTIQTKESSVFKSKALDTLLNFNGMFQIRASSAGIVTQVDKLTDDYVADGDQLCMIAQKSSMVFLLNVPYELNQFVQLKMKCQIELPDHTLMSGTIDSRLSAVDAASQTQNFVVKPVEDKSLPENLVARIHIAKALRRNATILPKDAVLTDETQENYWVMKLINDSTAVKVPITKGIETSSNIEILTPSFSHNDRIILTGQYGLSDTASIEVINAKGHE